jgi:2-methylcitrate dehydratase PrpD
MELEYNDIHPEAISKAKLLLLDFLGYAVIGSLEPSSKIVAKLLIESGGRKESTIFTYEGKYPCFNAALANGVMAHSCELDDTHRRTMMHPGDSIIPSALAVAERENKNGEELLTAMIAAYEITIRIAEAVMP